MDRLGATEWREPPIRPKNMQRRTFKRLEDELWDAWVSDASANLGVSLDRDALANLGSAELLDIADIALRRRRRKSSNQ
jgi:DNA polymerase III delta subunit